jgi:hypothetical protein
MFWEWIAYLDSNESFPSTKEKYSYWVGVSDYVGDHITPNETESSSRSISRRANHC